MLGFTIEQKKKKRNLTISWRYQIVPFAYVCNISYIHGIIVLAKSSESGMQNGIGMVASGINGGVMVGR